MRFLYTLLLFFCLGAIAGCVPVGNTSSTANNSTGSVNKQLRLQDYIYERNIQSVLLYAFDGSQKSVLNPAAISITQNQPLILQFDDLVENVDTYNAKIIHCDYDWQQSDLNNMEYLNDFNEFYIEEYQYSFNTRIPYVHYRFQVPPVKIPGNYLLTVYRDQNENDLILSKRFIVYSNSVTSNFEILPSTGIVERNLNQQAEFVINYNKVDVSNPYQDIKVVIRQNHRWDNAIYGLQPTLIREDQKTLVYRHFNLENNFPAGNEFRFFDFRSVSFLGTNVADVQMSENSIDAFLFKDKIRSSEVYSQYEDLNGKYIPENVEPGRDFLESEYADVHFYLQADNPFQDQVYIMGELTNWNYRKENQMKYDPEMKAYTGTLTLKQGWYYYVYLLSGENERVYDIEGSHFETENNYELLVYYRAPGSRADILVGYNSVDHNPLFR